MKKLLYISILTMFHIEIHPILDSPPKNPIPPKKYLMIL